MKVENLFVLERHKMVTLNKQVPLKRSKQGSNQQVSTIETLNQEENNEKEGLHKIATLQKDK